MREHENMNQAKEWICLKCCWFDGDQFCLKAKDYNFDNDGVKGCCSCTGFIEIPKREQEIKLENMAPKNTLNQDYFCHNCKKSIIFDDQSMDANDWNSMKVTCKQCNRRINWEDLLIQPNIKNLKYTVNNVI